MPDVGYTVEQALEKMRHYCAYQERCHQEVRSKLDTFPLDADEVDTVVSRLIEEDYLNEERFAAAFAGGKFRVLHWGRIRICHELKRKGVSEYNIRKGLSGIDEEEYRRVLNHLANSKWVSEQRRAGDDFTRRRRLASYLVQKGYEPALAWEAVSQQ